MRKKLIMAILLFLSFAYANSFAQIKDYESTENAGLNKKERIDNVESYLATMAQSLKAMEAKLDGDAKRIIDLDKAIKAIRDEQMKGVDSKLGEAKVKPTSSQLSENKAEASELEKLKADVLALKNKDIEKLKTNVDELSESVKAIQAALRK